MMRIKKALITGLTGLQLLNPIVDFGYSEGSKNSREDRIGIYATQQENYGVKDLMIYFSPKEAQAITTTQESLNKAGIKDKKGRVMTVRQFEQMAKQGKFPLLDKNAGLDVIIQPGESGHDLVDIVYNSAKGQFGISYPVEALAKNNMFYT